MTTFYRKYRGQTLDEIDLTDVRESLTKIVKSGNIPHAFLFSGPKGTGKTSAARILAKIVNCEKNAKKLAEPCNKCDQCVSITKGTNIDVIELDAASNRGIDDVRALRDAVKLAPARARKKIYIIDEAHMLTLEASNALLKTLEEPPDHVIFILATTNPEKLIETIRSRATNIIFKKGTGEEIERSLLRVTKGEKIKINKEALALIAQKADGSFRDAQKTLEQMVSEGRPLGLESVNEFLFKRKAFNIEELILSLSKKDTKKALSEIKEASDKGVSIEDITSLLLSRFREGLLAKVGIGGDSLPDFSKEDLITLIELFSKSGSELKGALLEELPIELAIVKWCGEKDELPDLDTTPSESTASKEPDLKDLVKKEVDKKASSVKEITDEVWRNILASVRPINTVVEALLRAAKPLEFDGETLVLGVFYRFHKERLEVREHRKILEDVAGAVIGTPIKVICRLTEAPTPQKVKEEKKEAVLTEGEDKDIIKIAEEIFGN